MAAAMEWVWRIIAVSLEMFLPGLAGNWLDRRWGTSFLGPLGFVVGVVFGTWYLIVMTTQPRRRQDGHDEQPKDPFIGGKIEGKNRPNHEKTSE